MTRSKAVSKVSDSSIDTEKSMNVEDETKNVRFTFFPFSLSNLGFFRRFRSTKVVRRALARMIVAGLS